MKEKLDRYDDSVRAVKSAIAEGYLPGAGTAMLKSVGGKSGIIYDILSAPLIQICKNAGVDHQSILIAVMNGKENDGYNAKTDRVEDLLEAGVVDPVKVLRCSLQNAASAAGAILTTECLIADFC